MLVINYLVLVASLSSMAYAGSGSDLKNVNDPDINVENPERIFPNLPDDNTKETVMSAEDYAFATAKNAKMTYLYARFIHVAQSRTQIKLYTQKAINYGKSALATADSAIMLLNESDQTSISYLNKSKAYTKQSIDLLVKIDNMTEIWKCHEIANHSAIAAGGAVINAYNASLYISDEPNQTALNKEKKQIQNLHQLPNSLSDISLLPAKDVLLHKDALSDTNLVTAEINNQILDDISEATTAEQRDNHLKPKNKKEQLINSTKDKSNSYLYLGLIAIALGAMFIISTTTASASICSIPSVSDITGNKAVSDLVQLHLGKSDVSIIDNTESMHKNSHGFNNIVNSLNINSIQNLDNYFTKVYAALPAGGFFIGCVESIDQRRRRITSNHNKIISGLILTGDFILNRLIPKMPVSSGAYDIVTKKKQRAISLSETLGRLIYHGFRIEDQKTLNGLSYIVCSKNGKPANKKKPSTGILFKTEKIGYLGKPITVYKLRTMRPYAEYLQEYIYEKNNLQSGGKFSNDFRVASWGRLLRSLWIDEWPMLINLFKGEIKLVGVRPLSNQFMNLYSDKLKKKRIMFKPGLIPPFYADLPSTLDEIMNSEMRYLEAYEKAPFKTDFRYFFTAVKNIIFKRARSN